MKSWMLGAAMVAGAAALGATQTQAAEFGIYVRGPVAYVPPCPGPDYFWVDGYSANGYWVPGRWEFRAPRWEHFHDGWRGPAERGPEFGGGARWERRDFDRGGRDFERHGFEEHGRGRW